MTITIWGAKFCLYVVAICMVVSAARLIDPARMSATSKTPTDQGQGD